MSEDVADLSPTMRRPRARGLSRDFIVEQSRLYLRKHPTEQLTIARAAAAAGASPMAIYRHFKDGADLADAILAKVLEGLSDEIPRDADWRTQVRAWMEGIYQRLVSTPQSIQMMTINRGPTVAWVRASVALRRSLADSGLKGPELAEAVFWVGVTVAGFVQQTLARPLPELIEATTAAINKLEPDEIVELAPLAVEVPRIFRQGFDIMIERTLASVEKLIEA
jgi:AcrR family transcriptional regulator